MPYRDTETRRAKNRENEKRRYHQKPHLFRDANLRNLYGITLDEWNSMLVAQENRCAMPDCTADAPGGYGTWHTDHDHSTGRVRGLLCAKCNTLLGAYETTKYRHAAFEHYIQRS
jgi:hypothetical protein